MFRFLLKGDGAGGFSGAVSGTDYVVPSVTSLVNLSTVGTITSGIWNGSAIDIARGGTNITTYTTGDMLYASAANTLSKLAAGTDGQVLTMASGVPTWAASAGGSGGVKYGEAGSLAYYASAGTNATGTPADSLTWDNTNKYLGIGTATPNRQLHIYNTSGTVNAEIDLQSVATSGHYWGIYHAGIGGSEDLRFWYDGADRVKINTGGSITATEFLYSSDARLKDNITPLSGVLDKISNLNGVSFNWKNNGKADIGFIAQDVERIYPELVSSDENGFKSLEYGNITAVLLQAIKELKAEKDAQIKDLQERIEKLENK